MFSVIFSVAIIPGYGEIIWYSNFPVSGQNCIEIQNIISENIF